MVAAVPSLPNSVDHTLINELEARTFTAWSPLDQTQLGGWRLGCAHGYTRRANSVYPLAWSSDESALQAQIDDCERWYSDHQQGICFKLTDASQPSSIDAMLETRGYAEASGALVMTTDLSSRESAVSNDETITPSQTRICIERQFTERWLDALCEMNAVQAPHKAVIRQMLTGDAGGQERYFGTVSEGSQPSAVGLAVRDGDYIGLFDIVTDETLRRRGHARRLVNSLLDAGTITGARTAYLQVVERNAPAISLYQSLGFQGLYKYWYRHKA